MILSPIKISLLCLSGFSATLTTALGSEASQVQEESAATGSTFEGLKEPQGSAASPIDIYRNPEIYR